MRTYNKLNIVVIFMTFLSRSKIRLIYNKHFIEFYLINEVLACTNYLDASGYILVKYF